VNTGGGFVVNAILDTNIRMSTEEFAAWANLPENSETLYELDEGRIVSMTSPGERHGLVCAWITYLLWQYAIRAGTGRVLSNDTGVILAKKLGIVRGPDVMSLAGTRIIGDVGIGHVDEIPNAVVEVISPSDRFSAILRRVEQYLKRGVGLVWVVDPEDHIVHEYRPSEIPKILGEFDDLLGGFALPAFECKVADFFGWPIQNPPKDAE